MKMRHLLKTFGPLAAFLLFGSSASLAAGGFPASCAGTYLMAEDYQRRMFK